MTEQEAIEILDTLKGTGAINGTEIDAIDVIGESILKLEKYRAIGTIEECRAAVEKQKPIKPVKTDTKGYRYTDTYRCPTCGGNFSGTGIADYCYHCGQRLDWSEEE